MKTSLTEPAFWVLTALAAAPCHGYAILPRVAALSGDPESLRITTLYATLDRLERSGHVRVASEEIVDGRARRTYENTEQGQQVLAAEAERLAVRAHAAQASLGQTIPGLTRPAWSRSASWAPTSWAQV